MGILSVDRKNSTQHADNCPQNGHGGWGIHPGMNFGKYMENELGGTATNHIWFVKKKRKLEEMAAGVIRKKVAERKADVRKLKTKKRKFPE